MVYKVVRASAVARDLGLILDHLVTAYVSLGDPLDDAFDRAAIRIRAIETDMETLGRAPYQGTLHPNLLPGLRQVTKNQAIFYFDIDSAETMVRVLAVFFGGQDHQRHMLARLGRREEGS